MNCFVWHQDYCGRLACEDGAWGSSELSGFHFRSEDADRYIRLQEPGTYFGFVMQGSIDITNPDIKKWTLHAGQWFSIANEMTLQNSNNQNESRVVVIRQETYRGVYAMGGPVEKKGRLRYIDGCSDSLLLCPARLGDPCLNHLHFPAGVRQTMHNHPSARLGAVIAGHGLYVTKTEKFKLQPGSIFMIPADLYHHFETTDSTLDVFAYHPDSDWGPQDEIHPMINRTWINGKKIEIRAEDVAQIS